MMIDCLEFSVNWEKSGIMRLDALLRRVSKWQHYWGAKLQIFPLNMWVCLWVEIRDQSPLGIRWQGDSRKDGYVEGQLLVIWRNTNFNSGSFEQPPRLFRSLFKAPKEVIQELESLQRKLPLERKRTQQTAFDQDVSRSQKNGELGIGGIANRNVALLGKWHWLFPKERHSLWASILRCKCGFSLNGWDFNQILPSSDHSPWKSIITSLPSILAFSKTIVDNLHNIRFGQTLSLTVNFFSVVSLGCSTFREGKQIAFQILSLFLSSGISTFEGTLEMLKLRNFLLCQKF